MSIIRCPGCGKASVAVGSRSTHTQCSRCGQPFKGSTKPARADADTLEIRIREHLHGPHGLGRARRP